MRPWTENKRFAVVAAGRRSGKTELAKRRLVVALPDKKRWADARYFAAAPTRKQAKRIFWKDLKAMMPGNWVRRVYETDLCITTRFGSELWVAGLDRTQRIEGTPWDGGVLDEYADMKEPAWGEHVRPALSDRAGCGCSSVDDFNSWIGGASTTNFFLHWDTGTQAGTGDKHQLYIDLPLMQRSGGDIVYALDKDPMVTLKYEGLYDATAKYLVSAFLKNTASAV